MAKEEIKKIQNLQPKLAQHFMTIISENELTHAYLFVGSAGSGRLELAKLAAMRLFCQNPDDQGFPCGVCNECRRIIEKEHPDVVEIEPDGQSIKVDQVRFLKSEFSKSAVEGNQKVFIIFAAETMTTSAANSLLKFIEEPVGNTVAFLITSNRNLILPTILSRSQVVEFPQISKSQLKEIAAAAGIPAGTLNLSISLTNDLDQMKKLNENDWLSDIQQAVGKWFDKLVNKDDMAFVQVATEIMPLVHDKKSQQVVLDVITAIWHETLEHEFQISRQDSEVFPQQRNSIDNALRGITQLKLVAIMQDCLATRRQLLGNINFQNIVESLTLTILKRI